MMIENIENRRSVVFILDYSKEFIEDVREFADQISYEDALKALSNDDTPVVGFKGRNVGWLEVNLGKPLSQSCRGKTVSLIIQNARSPEELALLKKSTRRT